jgi:ribose/xylose/arabinose/galactoside ABC-type transport system permease subunit
VIAAEGAPRAGTTAPSALARALGRAGAQNLSLLLALLALVAIFGSLRPDVFFLPRNLVNIGLAITILGILAMAQTVVIVSGGLDVSVGSIVGLSTMCAAIAMLDTGSAALGVGAALAAGALAGLANGLVVTYGRVNPVIATLGTMAAFRGLAFLTSGGNSVSIVNPDFRYLGSGTLLWLPVPIVVLLATMALFTAFLGTTVVGRNVYAIGGNPTVARLAGIPIRRYQLGIYVMSGLAAGLAALMLASRTMSGQPASGSQGLELEAITAAILGGCALQGGKGTIVGAMLGVLIIGVLNNGLILTSVPTFYQLIAKGALLIVAVMVQEHQMRRAGEA